MCVLALLFLFIQGNTLPTIWSKISSLEMPAVTLPRFGRDTVEAEEFEDFKANFAGAYQFQHNTLTELQASVAALEQSQDRALENAAAVNELRALVRVIDANQKALQGEIARLQASLGQNVSVNSSALETLATNQEKIGAALSALQRSMAAVKGGMTANEEAIALLNQAPPLEIVPDGLGQGPTIEPTVLAPVILQKEAE